MNTSIIEILFFRAAYSKSEWTPHNFAVWQKICLYIVYWKYLMCIVNLCIGNLLFNKYFTIAIENSNWTTIFFMQHDLLYIVTIAIFCIVIEIYVVNSIAYVLKSWNISKNIILISSWYSLSKLEYFNCTKLYFSNWEKFSEWIFSIESIVEAIETNLLYLKIQNILNM